MQWGLTEASSCPQTSPPRPHQPMGTGGWEVARGGCGRTAQAAHQPGGRERLAAPGEAPQGLEGPQHWVLGVGEGDAGAGHLGAPVVDRQGQLPQSGLGAGDTLELRPKLRPGGEGCPSVSRSPWDQPQPWAKCQWVRLTALFPPEHTQGQGRDTPTPSQGPGRTRASVACR